MKTIAIGCDPNAEELKQEIIGLIEGKGFTVTDFGSKDPIYSKVAITVAESVAAGENDGGILLCGTGIGMSIAANKVPGAYAALCTDAYSAERARKSNDTNIMTIGALTIGKELAKTLVSVWLESEYTPGGRSAPKIQPIYDYEKKLI